MHVEIGKGAREMSEFALFWEIVIVLCSLPEVPTFMKAILIALFGIWTVVKIINWLSKKLEERDHE